ncbi:MAG: helix-turn-helix domain-containing protein [Candidatus Marinimicrobia bacterium]|nr:helix-turn-helix domain-containing protein [Candidatus Neomarinimicrobiota bacterium]
MVSMLINLGADISNKSLKRLLTTKEVADFLQISESRVYTLCSTQNFPYIKISSRRIRFEGDAVKEWINDRSSRRVN